MYLTQQWLEQAVELLESSQVPSARLDALILLEDAIGKDRSYLLAHPELEIDPAMAHKLEKQLVRRAAHEPLAYIRGRCEFYGREFQVSHATLQPRPETETMITLLSNLIKGGWFKVEGGIADLGTGSGCLAITAKLEWPELEVYATEIQPEALKIAKKNAHDLKADVNFFQGNLLEPLYTLNPSPFTLLCNLPYVPNKHTINQAAMQEPAIAIFGGEDGLDVYRVLFKQISEGTLSPMFVLTESLPFQHQELSEIAHASNYSCIGEEDFIQVFQSDTKVR